jgi:hypothetical protein
MNTRHDIRTELLVILHFFCPGNMFAAKCSYVSQLLSPFAFEKRTGQIHDYFYTMKEYVLVRVFKFIAVSSL